jgi:hypothetical protein
MFYSYLIGLNLQTQLACPLCPHILSFGSPLSKFVRRVLIGGTLKCRSIHRCRLALPWSGKTCKAHDLNPLDES